MFSLPWAWKSKGRVTPLTYKKKKVYCKNCEYFFKKLNDMYYMNREEYPVPNPVRIQNRQSHYKHHVTCSHPENLKEIVTRHDCFDEVRVSTRTNVCSPRNLNHDNDCHWFAAKEEEEEPDWEK
jgi:hypothetical protein